jgi:hypothetical protein
MRVRRLLGILGLITLFLPSFVLHGHGHDEEPTAPRCSTCVVAQHSPALGTELLTIEAPVLRCWTLPQRSLPSPARVVALRPGGRAPPAVLPTRFV